MTFIEVMEGSDGEEYNFTVKLDGATTGQDLSSYTAVTMAVVSKDLKTVHANLTLAFVSKAAGTIKYTTDTADAYPAIPRGKSHVDLLGQVKITGTGLKTITRDIEIRYHRDYSAIA